MSDEFNLTIKKVTCHTAGCINFERIITLPCSSIVYCGGCGNVIDDVIQG